MVSLCSVGDPISVENMVWTGTQIGVIGPYFFEKEGVTVTMNSEHYVAMLRNFLQPRMEEIVEEEECVVPTGWSCSSHSSKFNECFGRNFSQTSGLSEG
jgi:hypothetical protein